MPKERKRSSSSNSHRRNTNNQSVSKLNSISDCTDENIRDSKWFDHLPKSSFRRSLLLRNESRTSNNDQILNSNSSIASDEIDSEWLQNLSQTESNVFVEQLSSQQNNTEIEKDITVVEDNEDDEHVNRKIFVERKPRKGRFSEAFNLKKDERQTKNEKIDTLQQQQHEVVAELEEDVEIKPGVSNLQKKKKTKSIFPKNRKTHRFSAAFTNIIDEDNARQSPTKEAEEARISNYNRVDEMILDNDFRQNQLVSQNVEKPPNKLKRHFSEAFVHLDKTSVEKNQTEQSEHILDPSSYIEKSLQQANTKKSFRNRTNKSSSESENDNHSGILQNEQPVENEPSLPIADKRRRTENATAFTSISSVENTNVEEENIPKQIFNRARIRKQQQTIANIPENAVTSDKDLTQNPLKRRSSRISTATSNSSQISKFFDRSLLSSTKINQSTNDKASVHSENKANIGNESNKNHSVQKTEEIREAHAKQSDSKNLIKTRNITADLRQSKINNELILSESEEEMPEAHVKKSENKNRSKTKFISSESKKEIQPASLKKSDNENRSKTEDKRISRQSKINNEIAIAPQDEDLHLSESDQTNSKKSDNETRNKTKTISKHSQTKKSKTESENSDANVNVDKSRGTSLVTNKIKPVLSESDEEIFETNSKKSDTETGNKTKTISKHSQTKKSKTESANSDENVNVDKSRRTSRVTNKIKPASSESDEEMSQENLKKSDIDRSKNLNVANKSRKTTNKSTVISSQSNQEVLDLNQIENISSIKNVSKHSQSVNKSQPKNDLGLTEQELKKDPFYLQIYPSEAEKKRQEEILRNLPIPSGSQPVVTNKKITDYFRLNAPNDPFKFVPTKKPATKQSTSAKPNTTAKGKPEKLVMYNSDGTVYKPRKLFHGKRWCNARFYTYLQNKMRNKYEDDTINESEKLMIFIADTVAAVIKSDVYMDRHIENLKRELVLSGIIETTHDFYLFVADYLPVEFRLKSVPNSARLTPTGQTFVPYDNDKIFDKIQI